MPKGDFKGEARSKRHGAGLSDDDIRCIRSLPGPLKAIGEQFKISAVMVHHIKARKRWRHVADFPEARAMSDAPR